MQRLVGRRDFLKGAGAIVALGAVDACRLAPAAGRLDGLPALQLPALRLSVDRITRITVCTRPFRAQGPRTDVEKLGGKTVVHNYGHGGSGWSLSWGAGALATASAMATGERDVAVIGCGALGMTTALQLQRAGARVTIYAKDLPPNVRSSWATGLYTPDSRIALEEHVTPAFKTMWAQAARQSYETFQSFLGVEGTPVEFIDSAGVGALISVHKRFPHAPGARPIDPTHQPVSIVNASPAVLTIIELLQLHRVFRLVRR